MKAQVKVKPELEIIKEPIPHLLVPGEMGAVLELVVRDKKGKVTDRKIMRAKSFVRQFLELLWIHAYPLSEDIMYELRDTGNTPRWIPITYLTFACKALADDETFGIIVGSGTDGAATPVTIDDHKIETIINTGGAAGQLNYGGVTYGAPASDATTSQFTITRDFANATANPITVYEIALYVKAHRYNTDFIFMTIRDVISVAVPNGQTLTVNYRLQAVV